MYGWWPRLDQEGGLTVPEELWDLTWRLPEAANVFLRQIHLYHLICIFLFCAFIFTTQIGTHWKWPDSHWQ